jgi:hypothetical protein
MKDGGSDVGKDAVFDFGFFVFCHVHARHGVERVGCVGAAVGVDGVVGVAMVGNDYYLVAGLLGGLYGAVDTFVDCDYAGV